MAETDIYKQREPLPYGGKSPRKKQRRRRSASHRRFDDPKKRRSRNSGVRRLVHLSRKGENEKYFWTLLGVVMITLLLLVGIWQFFIRESMIRAEEREDDYIEYQRDVPESGEPIMTPRPADPAN